MVELTSGNAVVIAIVDEAAGFKEIWVIHHERCGWGIIGARV